MTWQEGSPKLVREGSKVVLVTEQDLRKSVLDGHVTRHTGKVEDAG